MRQNRDLLTSVRIPVSDIAASFRENALKNALDYSVWGIGVLYIVAVAVSMAKV